MGVTDAVGNKKGALNGACQRTNSIMTRITTPNTCPSAVIGIRAHWAK
jgi:hypothetical protein